MTLPVLTQHIARTRLGAYCERRVPATMRDQVRLELEFADNHVTLLESRPYFRDPSTWTRLAVARFRFNAAAGTWSLDSARPGQKDGWRPYPVPPSRDLERLIRVIDQDENGVFWG
jgi:Protein of unknown function (DUF3024)